jgi:RNA polymerase-binding transcription factor DksA
MDTAKRNADRSPGDDIAQRAELSGAKLTAELRRRLLDARQALFRTIGATDEELIALRTWQPGDPLEHAHSTAAATLLSRLEGQEKHELDEIVDALARLEGDTYGLCEGCRGATPLECRQDGARRPVAAKLLAFKCDHDDCRTCNFTAFELVGRVSNGAEDQATRGAGAPDQPLDAGHHGGHARRIVEDSQLGRHDADE